MIRLSDNGVYLLGGQVLLEDADKMEIEDVNNRLIADGVKPLAIASINRDIARTGTVAYKILSGHNTSGDNR
jgi:hypothetical protein